MGTFLVLWRFGDTLKRANRREFVNRRTAPNSNSQDVHNKTAAINHRIFGTIALNVNFARQSSLRIRHCVRHPPVHGDRAARKQRFSNRGRPRSGSLATHPKCPGHEECTRKN
ncbi:unnamed protein product [Peniophora sp. CBMAI 1063]|nr:unnamed protein product [Peniophora sp. CBMAI 1063]